MDLPFTIFTNVSLVTSGQKDFLLYLAWQKLFILQGNKVCEKPPINKIPKMTSEPSKLHEEMDIRTEEESSDSEIDTFQKSRSIEAEYVNEKILSFQKIKEHMEKDLTYQSGQEKLSQICKTFRVHQKRCFTMKQCLLKIQKIMNIQV